MIFARFIENANVRAGDCIIVEESVINATMSANNFIEMIGKKQIIVGGNYTVGNYLNCKVIGSENYVTTNVTSGLLGDEKEEMDNSQKRSEYIKTRSLEIDKQMSAYVVKKANSSLTEAEQKELDSIKNEKQSFREEEKKIKILIDKIEGKIKERINSTVNIEEKAYPNVNIILNKQIYNIQKEAHKVSFVLKDNKVVMEKIVRKPINLNFEEELKYDRNAIIFADYSKMRRNITLAGKNANEIFDKASFLLDLPKERIVSLMLNKTDAETRVAFFEVKEKENPAIVRKKAMSVVTFEKVQMLGETIEECLDKAAKTFLLPVDQLEYSIIQKGAKGMLGMGKKDYILEVFKKKVKKSMSSGERNVDGKIETSNAVEGLKLKVTKPLGTGKTVEIENVETFLESKKYSRDIDKKKIVEIVEKADGEFIIIGPRQPELDLDAKFVIDIADDKLSVIISIIPPKKGGIYPNIEDIKQDLASKNIRKFDFKELEESYSQNHQKDYKVVVARGKSPIPSKPPRVELKFENTAGKQDIGDEQIDLRSISSIVNVIEGQLLVVIEKGKEGEAGEDVFGNIIPVHSSGEIPIKAGKNVRVSDDGAKYYSEIEGWIIFENNTIKVDDVYHINGDVDYTTGNISSLGTVIVKGSIKDGFKIEATGDIIITAVEGAELVADGNITIKSGVQGHGSALLKCKGNLYAKFIEQASIECEGDVIVSEAIMHSNIMAKGNIIVLKGKKGWIVGGKYRAGTVIAAKTAGSKVATPTSFDVGYDPFVKTELDKTQEKTIHLKQEYIQTRLNLQRLVTDIQSDPNAKNKKEMLKNLTEKYQKMALEVKEMNVQLQKLQIKLRENKKGYIFIKEKAFTNIEISIRNLSYKVREEIDFCTFYDDNGEIKMKEFDEIWLNKYAGKSLESDEKQGKSDKAEGKQK